VAQLGARGGAVRYKHISTDGENVEKIEKRRVVAHEEAMLPPR
jgi:hypothetical protein